MTVRRVILTFALVLLALLIVAAWVLMTVVLNHTVVGSDWPG